MRDRNLEHQAPRTVTEIVIRIKGSKTDELNVGCTRNQFCTGESLCKVEACVNFWRTISAEITEERSAPACHEVAQRRLHQKNRQSRLDRTSSTDASLWVASRCVLAELQPCITHIRKTCHAHVVSAA